MPRVRITWADLSNKCCFHLFGMPHREPLTAGTDRLFNFGGQVQGEFRAG